MTKDKKHNESIDEQTIDTEMTELTETSENEIEQSDNVELSQIEILNQQLAQEKENVEKEKKEYLFLMAEFDNFRKRTIKEKAEIIRNASESVLKGLLPIVDDFERGLAHNTSSSQADIDGMELIYKKLVRFLEQNGVKEIESNGVAFDPDFHEAIALVPTEDENLKGKVIDTQTKGYTINDKVLRFAKVAVGQ